MSPNSIKRISVAVVVNNKQTVDQEGNPVTTPYTEQELAQFTLLVKEMSCHILLAF